MFYVNFYTLWSLGFFFPLFYTTAIFSFILYSIPVCRDITTFYVFKKSTNFEYLTGYDIYWAFIAFLSIFLIINFSWSSPIIISWFGNLIFSQFQEKLFYFILFFCFVSVAVYCSSFYFSSKSLYDFMIVLINFFFWIVLLFFSNNILSFFFLIEVLSTLIMLLLITSTFSTSYFYNNLDLSTGSYFNPTTPFLYIQTLLYFFWVSLVTSLNLFFFTVLFYIKFFTVDWFFFDYIFFYTVSVSDSKDLFLIFFIWLNFLFCIFLKCGLVPFYFWKPVFFKGVPLHAVFFYIFFFYFFLLLFVIHFFSCYVNEIFFFFSFINVFLLCIGVFFLFFILCESYYIKAFFALSSILNTLFIFLALNGLCFESILFFV